MLTDDQRVKSRSISISDKSTTQRPMFVRSNHIEDIDMLNNSGSLDGVSFYKKNKKEAEILTDIKVSTSRSGSRSNSRISPKPINTIKLVSTSPDIEYHKEKQLEMLLLDSDSESDSFDKMIDEITNDNNKHTHDLAESIIEIKTDLKLDHELNTEYEPDFKPEPKNELKNEIKPEPKRDIKGYVDKIITDNETVGSMIVSKGSLFDKENTEKFGLDNSSSSNASTSSENSNLYHARNELDITDNSALLYYSTVFGLNEEKRSFVINFKDMMKELFVVMFFHFFLGIHNAIFNVISIDGILSCLIFYMSYIEVSDDNNFLLRNRLTALDRYIYYLLLFCGYYLFSYMTWFRFTGITMYCASILICPSIMGQIYNIYAYKKIRKVLYYGYHKLVQKIVCKQLSKILNIVIKSVFNLDTKINYEELIPFYNQFSLWIINKFVVTFVTACIFNHVDKGGFKFPLMIYKNLYLKDNKYNIANDKEYLHKLITDKQWNKFMDVYTLNRIIRIIMTDDTQNSMLSDQVSTTYQKLLFKFNRVMFCWTIMGVSNLTVGILSFLLFISHTERPLRYLLNTFAFTFLSYFTQEQILILILCELFYPIVNSKLLTDVFDDTYQSLKRGFLSVYYRTRLESVLLSMFLFYISFYNYNILGTITICVLNLIIMFRMTYHMSFFDISTTRSDKLVFKNNIKRTIKHNVNKPTNKIKHNMSSTDASAIIRLGGDLNDLELIMTTPTNTDDSSAKENTNVRTNVNTKTNRPTKKPSKRDTLNTQVITHISKPVPAPSQPYKQPIGMLNGLAGVDELSLSQVDINRIDRNDMNNMYPKITYETENTDLLLILKDRIKATVQNNLLLRVINPFVTVEPRDILRILAHVFILLIMCTMSSFNIYHTLLLPIMVQNVIDLIY